MIKLRDYQKKINKEVLLKFKIFDSLLCTASMGAGKSVIIANFVKENKDKNIVILTNISELINQLSEHLNMFNLDYQIVKSKHELNVMKNDNKNKIWLIMEQSFYEKKRNQLNIKCDILIKDEFHIGYNKKRYLDILESLKPKKILGFSGTPIDEQGFLLEGFKNEQIISYGNSKELTDLGYLVPLKYFIPKWSEDKDYSKIKVTSNDYSTKELDKKINTIEHINLIIKSINEMNGKNKKTVIFANSIEHADNIYNKLKKEKYKVGVIHNKVDKIINDKIIKNFNLDLKDNEAINCIVSVNKLTTGYNQPNIQLLVLVRPTKILRLYLQIVFRAARTYKNKKYAEILDLAQCLQEHGFGIQPRNYLPNTRKNKIILKSEKEKNRLTFLKKITKEKPTEINPDEIKLKIKEFKILDLNIKNTFLNNLIKMYNNSLDFEILTSLAFEINFRINKIDYINIEVLNYQNKLKEKHKITDNMILLLKKKQIDFIKNKKQKLININF